jgi:sugar-specific transcriptional regulator TrmB
MILKPELVKKVRNYFALNIYETKVWLALLSKGVASAGEIAEISEVPRSRTYDVLESLEKRGYAIAKIGKPVKYMAVKPTLVIEKLKNKTMVDAKEKVSQLSTLKDTQEYSELESLHKEGVSPVKRAELSGAIRGKSNIFSHIREILENSKNSVIICTSAKDLESKSRIFTPLFEKLKKANVKIKIVLSGTEPEIKALSKKFDLKIKKIDIEGRFFISDNNQILFLLSDNGSNPDNEMGIWINSEFFVSSLVNMFDLIFKNNK